MSVIFRIPDPAEFKIGFAKQEQKYRNVGHALLFAQLTYEINLCKEGYYKLSKIERENKISEYIKCQELVKADYKEKRGKELEIL
ncbi:hypothetical protein [Vagococcus fluvialis]|uniref:hypothetical protein n=1 Tax=Vagococcus fluvialis TaxID=2738 RepID=UPI003B21CF79